MTKGAVNAVIQGYPISSLDAHGIDGIAFSSGTGTRVTVISVQVNGGYSGYVIRCPGSGAGLFYRTFIDVFANNTLNPSQVWEMPSAAYVARWINCSNPDPVFRLRTCRQADCGSATKATNT
jgi:hypothetical protein